MIRGYLSLFGIWVQRYKKRYKPANFCPFGDSIAEVGCLVGAVQIGK